MSGYSLHIGLNLVDPASYDGWDGQLSGCVNDAHAMRDLASAAGFQTRIMLDGQATSQAVVGALGELARQATPGDICLVTYSGHGGQVEDVNGDEDDGLDETWVLFDRQVVDDELYQMYSQFAAGVRVVVLSDSCHSGTVAKHVLRTESRKAVLGAARGQGRGATGDVSVVTGPPRSMPYGAERHDNERRRGTYQFVQALSGAKGDADIRAGVLLISGCQDNQLSYDGDVNGQFTGTLLRTWAAGSFTGDYVAFHRRIVDQMPPDQTPNLFTVGAVDPGFTAQRPFTLAAPAATGGSQQGGGQQ
ncbi:MAG: caspase family protein, partial [Nocardioidaceae bacterium]